MSHPPTKHATIFHALLFVVLIAASCRDSKVASYRIPKEAEALAEATPARTPASAVPGAASVAPGAMASTPMAIASGPGLVWTAPAHWQVKPASSMRKGSYTLSGSDGAPADIAITAFPGDVGGEIANVNRWRGQLQLPPLPEAEVAGAITRLEENGLEIGVVDFENAKAATPTRLLGAMVPFGGATWFFKVTGPAGLVAGDKPAFLAFLKTVKPAPVPTP